MESIAKTLGTGSGIDISSLVEQLVEAQFAAKTASYEKKGETLEAQISAVSQLKAGISGFSQALTSLAKGGSLSSQPNSSDSSILTATLQSGAKLSSLDARIEVRQLASAQVASSAVVADPAAHIGTGTLTLTFGTATVTDGAMESFVAGSGTPVDITIGEGDSSLEGIAAAINAADAGVTASILSDGSGSRLVLKSATGAEQAFTLSATETEGDEGLAALAIGVGETGTTIGTAAADAIVALDGIALTRSSNMIDDLITGVTLDLASAEVGKTVKIGLTPPTESLRQVVTDVVDTYNQLLAMLKEATDPVSGPLRNDTAVRTMMRSLSGLTLQSLGTAASDGAPTTLAELGVATQRDGTLTLDSDQLDRMLTAYPAAVETMFASATGLPAKLATIATAATSSVSGLGGSEARYTAQQRDLSEDQEDAVAAAEALRARMTQQFAAMDAKVAVYKSTQSFLEQQVEAWNAARG